MAGTCVAAVARPLPPPAPPAPPRPPRACALGGLLLPLRAPLLPLKGLLLPLSSPRRGLLLCARGGARGWPAVGRACGAPSLCL